MSRLWSYLATRTNRERLTLIATLLVIPAISGLWSVFIYVFPKENPNRTPQIVILPYPQNGTTQKADPRQAPSIAPQPQNIDDNSRTSPIITVEIQQFTRETPVCVRAQTEKSAELSEDMWNALASAHFHTVGDCANARAVITLSYKDIDSGPSIPGGNYSKEVALEMRATGELLGNGAAAKKSFLDKALNGHKSTVNEYYSETLRALRKETKKRLINEVIEELSRITTR